MNRRGIVIPVERTRSRIPSVLAARHAAWVRMHREGATAIQIARASGVRPAAVAKVLRRAGAT